MIKLPKNFELDRYGLHVRLVRKKSTNMNIPCKKNI